MKIGMRKRLILCFGLLVAVVIGLGIGTYVVTMKMSRSFDTAVNLNTKKLALIAKVNIGKSDMRTAQRGTVMFTFAGVPDRAEKARKEFYEKAEATSKATSELEAMLTREAGKKITRAINEDIEVWKRGIEEAHPLLLEGKAKEADTMIFQRTTPVMDDLAKQCAKLQSVQENIIKEEIEEAESNSRMSTIMATAFILLGTIIGVVALLVVRGISKQVESITEQLGEGSGQVASAADEISSASQTLAQGSSEQAATLQQAASAISEISSMTEKNAANAKSAAELTIEAAREIDRGNQKLEEMVAATASISESSTKVSKILKVIDEIAFQTNILALNAAVEAARAGETGAGFAVVADEVRNLAQRCAQAANDTAALVEESLSKSKEGQVKVEEVAHAITAITEKSNQIRILVDEVSAASQEQSKGLHDVSQSVMQMEEVTQRNAASAEEGAAGGAELSSQSDILRGIVASLETLVRGEAGKQEQPSAAKNQAAPHKTIVPKVSKPLNATPLNAFEVKQPDHNAFPMDEEDVHKFFSHQ